MSRMTCELLLRLDGNLLEAPCWDPRDERLLWVDIPNRTVYAMSWASGNVTTVTTLEEVSAVLPLADAGEVLACRSGLTASADPDRIRLPIESHRSWARTNDAACDPAGRLWVGTMADDASPGTGTLYRVEPDWSCHAVVGDLTISNGLGWSPSGDLMYVIDSATRALDVFDYDIATGAVDARRTLVDTSEWPGLPDGLAVDVEGAIWVAFYGGSAVRRFAPDGHLLATVEVPTENPTSCAFAGPALDQLVITTARASDQSSGGDLYVLRPGTTGLPHRPFAG